MVGGAIKALNHENQTQIQIMKTLMITLGLVAFGLATMEAGNGHQYGKQASSLSGDYLTQAGGGGKGNGNGNGNGERTRKRDGSGDNCQGGGECDGSGNGNGQRTRKRNGGN